MTKYMEGRRAMGYRVGTGRYEVRIERGPQDTVHEAFDGLEIAERPGVTVITGEFDQSALHGVLERVRSLGLDIVEVRRVRGFVPDRPPAQAAAAPWSVAAGPATPPRRPAAPE